MATVSVGCKLPNGIHLDHKGKRVTLNGANHSRVVGGYGITENVDKAFFDAWMAEHKEFAPVKANLIFAQPNTASAESEAQEKGEVKSGLEGVDPEKPAPGIKKADNKD